MARKKVMRDINLNEEVSISLPAYVWLGFSAAYICETSFNSPDANEIISTVQRALLDPLYIKEQEAQHQLAHDQQESIFKSIMGQKPEVPPNMEDTE